MGLRLCGKKLSNAQTILFFIITSVAWASLIVTLGVLNLREGDRRANRATVGKIDPENFPADFSGVAIMAKISNIDLIAFRYIVHFDVYPVGDILDKRDTLSRTPLSDIKVTFDTQSKVFPSKQVMAAQDLTFTITDGDTNSYPFDRFSNVMHVFASRSDQNATEQPIPVAVSLIGALQSWSFELNVNDTSSSIQTVTMTFERSFTTKFFSLFIIATMWILSVCILVLAVSLWTRNQAVESPAIASRYHAFVSSMLFALPAVRGVQPGIPSIGCVADVMGFFWNMVFIALAAFLMLVMYIRKKREKNTMGILDSPAEQPKAALFKTLRVPSTHAVQSSR